MTLPLSSLFGPLTDGASFLFFFIFFFYFRELVISYVYMMYDVTWGNCNKANTTVRLDTTVSANFKKKDRCSK